jgi:SWI/SNF-related matrix-associated actin-dependent regulator 1 of chromatin subfamily A
MRLIDNYTSLKYNEATKKFIVYTDNEDLAEHVGLTKSTKVRGPKGELVWFTDSQYAALPYYKVGDESAQAVLSGMNQDYEDSFRDHSPSKYPAPPGKSYLPYQIAGIDYAIGRQNSLIGDEPGLGKTIQAIGLANAVGAKKVLVICPASIRLNWQREINAWSTIPRVTTYPVLKGADGINPQANYTIISYELARAKKLHEVICDMKWDLLVIDEAHYLKTPDSKRTQAVFGGGRGIYSKNKIIENCTRTLALTGTPLPNRPRECYTLSRGLCWESIDWMTYDNFCYRFNPSKLMESGAKVEKRGRLPELRSRLRSNFMVRRLKADVLKDLPDKRYEMEYIEANGQIKTVLQQEKLIDFDPGDLHNPSAELWGQISTVRREMGEAKLPAVIERLKCMLDLEEIPKIVMFSHHKSVMDGLLDALSGYGLVQVRGGMSPTAKNQSVKDFINNDSVRLFSGQLDAAGFGIDGLQHVANRVFVVEPAWTPGTNEQAIDRCHRIGQHDNVIAGFAVVAGSFDERVLASVFEKAKNIHNSLDKVN